MPQSFDKIGRPTGAGKVADRVVRDNGIVAIVDLYNYNIDGNTLKDEHKAWMDSRLIPLLKGFAVHVKLRGTASKSGDREYNRQLSLSRVLRVKKYLIDRGVPEAKVPGPDIQAAGEDLSTSDSHEDERDRAVRITVALGTKPRPVFPTIILPPIVITPNDPIVELPPQIIIVTRPRKKIPINVSQSWGIKQLSSVELEFQVGMSAMAFQIVDFTNHEEVICVMPGISLGEGTPAAITLRGPMNPFTTPQPQRITDFSGRTTWTSLFDIGPFSKDAITFHNGAFPTGAFGDFSVTMDTGFTIGASGPSMHKSYLFCSDPRPFP
jgi:hypothetical protein